MLWPRNDDMVVIFGTKNFIQFCLKIFIMRSAKLYINNVILCVLCVFSNNNKLPCIPNNQVFV